MAPMQTDPLETNPSKLRELASWYRDFAERAGNLAIWEGRLHTADKLEAEADLLERTRASRNPGHVGQAGEEAG
jgi:hypothetical protein